LLTNDDETISLNQKITQDNSCVRCNKAKQQLDWLAKS